MSQITAHNHCKKRKLDLNYISPLRFVSANYPHIDENDLSVLTQTDWKSKIFPRSEKFYSELRLKAEYHSYPFHLFDKSYGKKVEKEINAEVDLMVNCDTYYTYLDSLMCAVRTLFKNPIDNDESYNFYFDYMLSPFFQLSSLSRKFRNSNLEGLIYPLVTGFFANFNMDTEKLISINIVNLDFNFGSFDLEDNVFFVTDENSFFDVIYRSLYCQTSFIYLLYKSTIDFKFDIYRWYEFLSDDPNSVVNDTCRRLVNTTFGLGKKNLNFSLYNIEFERKADIEIKDILGIAKAYKFKNISNNVKCISLMRAMILDINYKKIDYESENLIYYLICLKKFFYYGFAVITNENIVERSKQLFKMRSLPNERIYKDLMKKNTLRENLDYIMSGEPFSFDNSYYKDPIIKGFSSCDREELAALTLPILIEIHIIYLFWKKSKLFFEQFSKCLKFLVYLVL